MRSLKFFTAPPESAGVQRRRSAFDPEHGQKGGVTDLEEEIQRYKRRGFFWISQLSQGT